MIKPKTQAEIDEQIVALKAIRPKVRPYTYFGDSNLDKLDAQIKVLEEDMDSDDVYNEWPEDEADMEVRMSAEEAINWREGYGENDDLTEDWPLRD